jgi:hypothetical protein
VKDERKLDSRWDKYSSRECVIELSVDRGRGLGDCLIKAMCSTAEIDVMGGITSLAEIQ